MTVLSGGSTPAVQLSEGGALTEMHPGVYVFGDAQHRQLGTCDADAVALTAMATVVSCSKQHVILDVGSKVLSTDRPAWIDGLGSLPEYPSSRISELFEHQATVVSPDGAPLPVLGGHVRGDPQSRLHRRQSGR